ncbi:MAG: DUF2905 domain-containing protein [Syntrophomonadaceae bacterium]|nr:DUF2905 domain-containing protein [Syntrophomonadaceae bacterium]
MGNMEGMAKILIGTGAIIVLLGFVFLAFSKLGAAGFRLPGDIYVRKGNFTFYFPLVTCILISLVLTLILNMIGRR